MRKTMPRKSSSRRSQPVSSVWIESAVSILFALPVVFLCAAGALWASFRICHSLGLYGENMRLMMAAGVFAFACGLWFVRISRHCACGLRGDPQAGLTLEMGRAPSALSTPQFLPEISRDRRQISVRRLAEDVSTIRTFLRERIHFPVFVASCQRS